MDILSRFKPKTTALQVRPAVPEDPADPAHPAHLTFLLQKKNAVVLVRPDMPLPYGWALKGMTQEQVYEKWRQDMRMLLHQPTEAQVDVEVIDCMQHFGRIRFHLPDWEGAVPFLVLIATVPGAVAEAYDKYRAGWMHKVMQMHQPLQDTTDANRLIAEALNAWLAVRRWPHRLLSDPELNYVETAMKQAYGYVSLAQVPDSPPVQIISKHVDPGSDHRPVQLPADPSAQGSKTE